MANIRLWSPVDHLFRDFADMSRLLDIPNVPVLFKGGEPKVDILQTEKDVLVKADVPGVKKEDIPAIAQGVLKMKGNKENKLVNIVDLTEKDIELILKRAYEI